MRIAVVGAGRIGLPLAASFAGRGHNVVACDISEARVDAINTMGDPIPDEAGLAALIRKVVSSGNLRATTATRDAVGNVNAVLFAVAVDVDAEGRADLANLLAAAADVAEGIAPGTLCIFDTTLPVGTTRRVIAPVFEAAGKTIGRDVFVAFSPERLLMGRVLEDIHKYPSVVGGLDSESGRRAADFYREALGNEVMLMGSAEAAELSKLAEGVYRDLNIALANELARTADLHGVDISEVIQAANSQPYCHLHVPGTGVGGHCIPVYPRFLVQGEGPSDLAALGRHVNDSMPGYAVARLEEIAGNLAGKRVLIMGLTFRPNVAVTHHTNALDLKREFEARGATVVGHDPLLTPAGVASLGFEVASEPLAGFDVAVVHANHREYAAVPWGKIAPLVLDARNALDRAAVEAAGSRYVGIGRPLTAPR